MSGQTRCLACGEVLVEVEVEMCVCQDCLVEDHEDDHDVHIPNMQSRAVDA